MGTSSLTQLKKSIGMKEKTKIQLFKRPSSTTTIIRFSDFVHLLIESSFTVGNVTTPLATRKTLLDAAAPVRTEWR
jgi:hypothetical protein